MRRLVINSALASQLLQPKPLAASWELQSEQQCLAGQADARSRVAAKLRRECAEQAREVNANQVEGDNVKQSEWRNATQFGRVNQGTPHSKKNGDQTRTGTPISQKKGDQTPTRTPHFKKNGDQTCTRKPTFWKNGHLHTLNQTYNQDAALSTTQSKSSVKRSSTQMDVNSEVRVSPQLSAAISIKTTVVCNKRGGPPAHSFTQNNDNWSQHSKGVPGPTQMTEVPARRAALTKMEGPALRANPSSVRKLLQKIRSSKFDAHTCSKNAFFRLKQYGANGPFRVVQTDSLGAFAQRSGSHWMTNYYKLAVTPCCQHAVKYLAPGFKDTDAFGVVEVDAISGLTKSAVGVWALTLPEAMKGLCSKYSAETGLSVSAVRSRLIAAGFVISFKRAGTRFYYTAADEFYCKPERVALREVVDSNEVPERYAHESLQLEAFAPQAVSDPLIHRIFAEQIGAVVAKTAVPAQSLADAEYISSAHDCLVVSVPTVQQQTAGGNSPLLTLEGQTKAFDWRPTTRRYATTRAKKSAGQAGEAAPKGFCGYVLSDDGRGLWAPLDGGFYAYCPLLFGVDVYRDVKPLIEGQVTLAAAVDSVKHAPATDYGRMFFLSGTTKSDNKLKYLWLWNGERFVSLPFAYDSARPGFKEVNANVDPTEANLTELFSCRNMTLPRFFA